MGETAACCGEIIDNIFACDNMEDKNVPNKLVGLAKSSRKKC